MNPDKVSFLIAAYNEENFLRECIQSCLDQQEADIEVCVVDDGSSDNTRKIIEEMMADPRVKGGFLPLNKGKVAAFNLAYSMATGEYISLVGADDVNVNTRSKLSIDALKLNNANLVYADYYVCDKDLKIMRVKKTGEDVRLSDLAFNNRVSGGTTMFDRTVACKVFPIPALLPFEDWWIAFIARLYFNVVRLDVPILFYRHHGRNDSVSGSGLIRSKKKDYMRHMAYYSEFLDFARVSGDVPAPIVSRFLESGIFKKMYVQDGFSSRLKTSYDFISGNGLPRTSIGWAALLGILPFGPHLFDLAFAAKELMLSKRNKS